MSGKPAVDRRSFLKGAAVTAPRRWCRTRRRKPHPLRRLRQRQHRGRSHHAAAGSPRGRPGGRGRRGSDRPPGSDFMWTSSSRSTSNTLRRTPARASAASTSRSSTTVTTIAGSYLLPRGIVRRDGPWLLRSKASRWPCCVMGRSGSTRDDGRLTRTVTASRCSSCGQPPGCVGAGRERGVAHSVEDAAALVRDFVKWDDTPASLGHFAESACAPTRSR